MSSVFGWVDNPESKVCLRLKTALQARSFHYEKNKTGWNHQETERDRGDDDDDDDDDEDEDDDDDDDDEDESPTWQNMTKDDKSKQNWDLEMSLALPGSYDWSSLGIGGWPGSETSTPCRNNCPSCLELFLYVGEYAIWS